MTKNNLEDKITIIEGPPPVFEPIEDGWALGLTEGPFLFDMSLTQVRTFNGPELVERCHRMWKENGVIHLHYRNEMGVEEKVPIMAARSIETDEGQVLLLWTRHTPEDYEDFDDLDDDDDEDEEEDDAEV
ncbi:MAG: hypothetical protein C4545_01880 [Anaerolineaceae bacterium]|jgi:hypothetical protein|nr:MAG: hypothetical protein C4545_01880 [Anaerolineaceae bacterium]